MEISMSLIIFWYLIGAIGGILMHKILFDEVTGQDLLVMLLFGGVLGFITPILQLGLLIRQKWNTKIF
jgi:hypothetical protein